MISVVTRDNWKVDDDADWHKKAGKDVNNIFRFTASDSDPKNNVLHNAFRDYFYEFQGNNFHDLFLYIEKYQEMIPISNWLHLCKI